MPILWGYPPPISKGRHPSSPDPIRARCERPEGRHRPPIYQRMIDTIDDKFRGLKRVSFVSFVWAGLYIYLYLGPRHHSMAMASIVEIHLLYKLYE